MFSWESGAWELRSRSRLKSSSCLVRRRRSEQSPSEKKSEPAGLDHAGIGAGCVKKVGTPSFPSMSSGNHPLEPPVMEAGSPRSGAGSRGERLETELMGYEGTAMGGMRRGRLGWEAAMGGRRRWDGGAVP